MTLIGVTAYDTIRHPERHMTAIDKSNISHIMSLHDTWGVKFETNKCQNRGCLRGELRG